MSSVYFAEVLGTRVGIVELKNFVGRHYRVKVAEDEENRHVRGQFFKDAEVVEIEKVKANFLCSPLLNQVKGWLENSKRKLYLSAGNPLDYFGKRAKGGVKHQRIHIVRV